MQEREDRESRGLTRGKKVSKKFCRRTRAEKREGRRQMEQNGAMVLPKRLEETISLLQVLGETGLLPFTRGQVARVRPGLRERCCEDFHGADRRQTWAGSGDAPASCSRSCLLRSHLLWNLLLPAFGENVHCGKLDVVQFQNWTMFAVPSSENIS